MRSSKISDQMPEGDSTGSGASGTNIAEQFTNGTVAVTDAQFCEGRCLCHGVSEGYNCGHRCEKVTVRNLVTLRPE